MILALRAALSDLALRAAALCLRASDAADAPPAAPAAPKAARAAAPDLPAGYTRTGRPVPRRPGVGAVLCVC